MASDRARIGSSVFLLSTAVLAFEVLLLRLFAIEQLHHFANMAIGMAMLGFGASGTVLVLVRRRVRGKEREWFETMAVLFTLSLIGAIPLAHSVTFDATQILWDPRQLRALAIVYSVLALPFVFGAAALALALMAEKERVGRVYAANLLGSSVGSVLAILLLAVLRPEQAVAATAIPAAAGAVIAMLSGRRRVIEAAKETSGERERGVALSRQGWRPKAIAAVGLGLVALGLAVWPPWSPRITEFKGLPQVAAFADAKAVAESWGPLGWAAAIRAPAFRHAPGLSLAFSGQFPPQTALFVDGATAGAATDWRGDTAALGFLAWLPSAAAYETGHDVQNVLVLGAGDGLDVLAALSRGARAVTAVELNEPLARLADAVLAPASRVYSDRRVRLVVGDARTFVARSTQSYDLLVLPITGEFSLVSGLHGLGEDYLNTVEAYASYLERLAPGGMLAITRWVDTPPRGPTKALLTAAAALRRRGVDDVGSAIVFMRSWAAATLLVKPDGFSPDEVQRLARFARERWFDLDWAPGTSSSAVRDPLAGVPDVGPPPSPSAEPAGPPDFNLIGRPVFAEAARAAAMGAVHAEDFARAYPFDVAPTTDDRPYFGRFLRITSIPSILSVPKGSWLPFAEWGYLALVATLLQSAFIAALLTIVPALALARGRRAHPDLRFQPPGLDNDGLGVARMLRVGVYFGSIGMAYLFVEIAVIQKLTLLLGHPVYAAAAVLALFLALSGVGSLGSDRLAPRWATRAALAVAIAAIVIAIALDLTGRIQPLAFPERLTASLLVLAPLATLMGMPFPLGLRLHAPGHAALAWAWAVNGFASVIAASLAALVSMEVGTRALLLVGAALYLTAAAVSAGQAFRTR